MSPPRSAAVRKRAVKPTRAPRPHQKTLTEAQSTFTAEGAPPPGRVSTGPALEPVAAPAKNPRRDDAPKPA